MKSEGEKEKERERERERGRENEDKDDGFVVYDDDKDEAAARPLEPEGKNSARER